MELKQSVKSLVPPILLPLLKAVYPKKTLPGSELQTILNSDTIPWVPWEPKYHAYKQQFIAQVLDDELLLKRFRLGERLPLRFGVGIDERCVEYPWLFSRLAVGAKDLLDAGSVLNHEFLLDRVDLGTRKLHIMTLAPEWLCFWNRGVSYLFGDLRDIPIRDEFYDTIICLSTLEHVGCDNTIYSNDHTLRESRPQDFQHAIQELRRVLRPNGSLFLTVPFGAYRHHGTFQQFDRALLDQVIKSFGTADKIIETFYRYTNKGWQVATDSECATSEYVEWVAEAWRQHGMPTQIPVEADLAAAARAVACVQFVKN